MAGGRGRASDDDDETAGRTPFFVLAFLLFIGLLTLVTRSHVSEAPSARRRPPISHTYRPHGSDSSSTSTDRDPPPPPPVVDPEVEKAKHGAEIAKRAATAKAEFTALKTMLETYWKGEGILADSWAFTPTHPEGLNFYAEKIARAIEHGLPLNVGVIGSSVAAGHDNCAYDSFENQLQRTLDEPMKKSGIQFTVNNAGQGGGCGDNMYNQVWCLRNMVGDQADFTIYSWTYFEAGQNQQALKNIHEAFIRWSLLMERAPVPTMLYAGDNYGGDLEGMFKQYAKFGFNVVTIRGGLKKHGQPKAPSWGDIGDGLHETTRYGETANETRKKSLGVFYRNWHPGPMGFQVVADALAWRFAIAALKAVEMLQGGKTFGKEPDLISTSALGKHTCTDMDAPVFEGKYCDVEEPPNCINHEIPTFGRPQVVYSDKSDTLNPMVDKLISDLEEKKNGASTLIPRDEKKGAECQHADVCRGYRTNFMTYRLPRMSTGYIKVCCVNWNKCGERLVKAKFYLDSKALPEPKRDVPDKCVIVEEVFQHQSSTGGHFYLSIDMTEAPDVYISHVIAQ